MVGFNVLSSETNSSALSASVNSKSVIGLNSGTTVNSKRAVAPKPTSGVIIIFALPALTACTSPSCDTVATFSFDDVHLTLGLLGCSGEYL